MNLPALPPNAITSRSNERVRLLREGFRGRACEAGELISVEGPNLVREALRAGLVLEAIFVRQGSEAAFAALRREAAALGDLRGEGLQTVLVSEAVFDAALTTHTPQGIAALARIPERRAFALEALRGVALLAESIQDPGNLGTLIRSAEAFGADAVLLAGETVNPWSPKVVRASAGSVFRVSTPRVRVEELQQARERGTVALLAATAQGEGASSVLDTDLRGPVVVMVGNEGSGLSAAALACATARVWIPCATESLNAAVAGSVLLFEAMRQRERAARSEGGRA